MNRCQTVLAVFVALAASVGTASADYWSPYVSEEDKGRASWCNEWNEGATGFGCVGSYCDDVRLLCQDLPSGVRLDEITDYWSEWSSEEANISLSTGGWYGRDDESMHVCNFKGATAGIVNGIKCAGSYCDDVSIECAIPKKTDSGKVYAVGGTSCSWSPWRSEEDASIDFGTNRFITGVQCRGSYCDDMRFFLCTFDGTKLVVL